jgi:hypothetical protein
VALGKSPRAGSPVRSSGQYPGANRTAPAYPAPPRRPAKRRRNRVLREHRMRRALRSIENLEALHFLGPIRSNIARNRPRESQDSPSSRSQWRFGSLPPTGHDPSHVSRQGGFARLIRPIFLERRFRGVEWRPGSSTSRRRYVRVTLASFR